MSDPQDQNPMARNANDPGYYSSVNVNVDGYDPPGSTVSADSMIDDTDSAIGDTESFRTTLTESLTPSVMDYRFENGRRYHAFKDGSYALPNDEQELERLDLQHQLWRLTLDGVLYLAPIPPSTNTVLDLGTGTGIWATEFADEIPSATVIGVDLSPIQPRWIPSNCSFQVDDIEADWTYPLPEPNPAEPGGVIGGFDFIHCRMLGLGLKDWPRLFRQSFAHLRPGGYFEAQEFDLLIKSEPDAPKQAHWFQDWSKHLISACKKAGVDARACLHFEDQLREAGFVDIVKRDFRWPVGPWGESKKDMTLGIWAQRNMIDGVEAAAIGFLSRYEGWTKEQIMEVVGRAREEIVDMGFHQYVDLTVYYARKPGGTDTTTSMTSDTQMSTNAAESAGPAQPAQSAQNEDTMVTE